MKRILSLVTLTVFAAFFSSCATPEEKAASSPAPSVAAPAESNANAEQEIRKLHQEYDKAWAQQDAAAFERLLADDFTLTDQDGKVTPKAEVITTAKSGEIKYEVGKSEDVKVRFYDNTALVTGRWIAKSTDKGKLFDGAGLCT